MGQSVWAKGVIDHGAFLTHGVDECACPMLGLMYGNAEILK